MHNIMMWCGFFGAWLLVAGPIYQAVLELQAEELGFDRIREISNQFPPPPPVSGWWWLVPPAHFELSRRRRNAYQRLVSDAMTDEDFEAQSHFINKAMGWFMVGVGGFLIASKETWELVEHLEWNAAIFWLLVVLMLGLSVSISVARTSRSERETERRRTLAAQR